MKVAWILSGVIAGGILVGMPRLSLAEPHDAQHADSGERVIDFRELPKPAQERVRHDFKEADIHRIVAYDVHGRTHFHVLIWAGDDHRTLVMDEEGNVSDIKYPVPFDSLPGRVKETIGHEAREDLVLNVEKITHGDRTYYVATIAPHRGEERVVRIDPDGALLKETYEDDVFLVSEREVAVVVDKPVGGGERVIDFRELPRPAQERVRHDFKEADIHRIIAYDVHGRTHFHVLIWTGDDHRTLVMDEDGNVSDIKYPVPFDHLPGRVKETIGHEAREDVVLNVEKIAHGDRTYYVATIAPHKGEERIVHIDPDGAVLKETYEDDVFFVSER